MILAVDIGNTNIVFGGFQGTEICFSSRISTNLERTESEYIVLIRSIFEVHDIKRSEIEGAIISSVVPPLTNVLKNVLDRLTGKRTLVVGPGLKTGLNIVIDDPSELGSDLAVECVAAIAKYPKPISVLDMGTATKFSVVDSRGDMRGVVIYPGVMVSFDALASRAAQLPRISFEAPKHVIGTNSIMSMQSGLIYGNAGMVDGIIDRIEEELGEKASLVATGGLCETIIKYCSHEMSFDPTLVLDGLRILYEKNSK